MIEINHLVKNYGTKFAVDDVSFRVGEGEIVGFLGPNGAGKSTTMNIMTGFLGLTSGQVIINGHDITFRATGLIDVTGGTNMLDRDDILEDVLKTGSAAIVAFTYTTTGGKVLSGNCVITNYSESSNAEDDATYTVDFKTTGPVTFAAAQ